MTQNSNTQAYAQNKIDYGSNKSYVIRFENTNTKVVNVE